MCPRALIPMCSVDQNPELRNCVNAPLQTRSLHFSQFDAQYRSAPEEPFTGREIDINSGPSPSSLASPPVPADSSGREGPRRVLLHQLGHLDPRP